MRFIVPAFFAFCSAAFAADAPKGLKIWWVDTEGGGATLIVTPAGESVLIDSGNPGGRDAKRIIEAATKSAGLKQIDHHVITHWHIDHFGGTEEVNASVPIGRFYDHGPSVEGADFDKKFAWYLKLSEGKRTILKPYDTIPLKADAAGTPIKLLCIAAHGGVISGNAVNPIECAMHKAHPEDKSDNACSVSLLLTFGSFKFLDCGDLTWNIEHKLVCPDNRIGTVDVYQTNHHGLAISNNPALLNAVKPRVAIMNNGAKKGGQAGTFAVLKGVPELEAVFQLHHSVAVPTDAQAPADRIANNDEKCAGDLIHMEVDADGKAYTVIVGAKGKKEKFQTR